MAAAFGGLPHDAALAVLIGAAQPGTPVPPLDELARLCGFDLFAAAAGLELLLERHAVELVPGSNRLVTRRIPYRIDRRVHASLSDGVERSGSIRPGMVFRSLVRSVEEDLASPAEACEALGLEAGTPLTRLRRERTLGDEVVVVGSSWLWPPPVEDLVARLFESGSLAALVEEGGGGGPYRRHTFRVALEYPPEEVAVLFGRARLEPAWWVQSVNGLDAGAPLELSTAWMRADVFRLLVSDLTD